MKYMDIWAKPKQKAVRNVRNVRNAGLPRRVKDWPEDARKVFNEVKNQLWTWSKKYEKSGSRQGLGLIAYMAVKQVWEDESDPRANMQIINCETEEDLWNTVSKIASRS